MQKQMRWVVMLFLGMGISWQQVQADEMDDLKRLVIRQGDQIKSLQKKLDTYETEDQKMTLIFQQKLTERASKKSESGLPDNLKWIEKIKFSGDLRYRHETIDEESGGDWNDGHNRNRIRARLMMNAAVNDEWDVGVRIASGSEDPVSTNQTLSGGFTSKDIWLDMAYLDYHPGALVGSLPTDQHDYGQHRFRYGRSRLGHAALYVFICSRCIVVGIYIYPELGQ